MKLIIAAVAATSLMTLFSYIVSKAMRSLYKEPVLLQKILHLLHVNCSAQCKVVLGWIIHYLIGFLFVVAYDLLWAYTSVDPTWFTAIIFGILSGIIGIIGWRIIFALPERTPNINFSEYYLQLFIAHIIFAVTAVGVYKLYAI